jgi:hypothetical protein
MLIRTAADLVREGGGQRRRPRLPSRASIRVGQLARALGAQGRGLKDKPPAVDMDCVCHRPSHVSRCERRKEVRPTGRFISFFYLSSNCALSRTDADESNHRTALEKVIYNFNQRFKKIKLNGTRWYHVKHCKTLQHTAKEPTAPSRRHRRRSRRHRLCRRPPSAESHRATRASGEASWPSAQPQPSA